jgi:AcrR family transcriptional regulator
VVEEELLDHSPAVHVRRPRLDYESHAIGLDRNEVGALLVAAGLGAAQEHGLMSLLAINGLRISEALGADIDKLAVIDRALDIDREYMDRAYTPERTPIEQLEEATRQYLRFYLDYPEFFRMLAFPAETGSYPAADQIAHRLAHRVDEQNARMIDAIDRGTAQGGIRPIDSRRAATVLWASWNGVISLGWRPDELREQPEALGELLTLAIDLIAWGLRTSGAGT